MNVDPVSATAATPSSFMAARSGDAADRGSGVRTASPSAARSGTAASGKDDSLTGRYTTVAFRYDTDALRLVMLFRNPADGVTVDQIPTETALKQYKDAQRLQKAAHAAAGKGAGGAMDGSRAGAAAAFARESAAGMGHATSGMSSSVVSSSRTNHAGSAITSGAAHVNVVL